MAKPWFIEALEKNDAKMLEQLESVEGLAGADGALSAKVKTLMSLLADAILAHPDGVKALAEKARAQGASEAQIVETVRMAFLCGGLPALVTATHAFDASSKK